MRSAVDTALEICHQTRAVVARVFVRNRCAAHPAWYLAANACTMMCAYSFSLAYSALACLRTGMSASASFQRVRKS